MKKTLVQDMEERIGSMIITELLKAGYYISICNEDGQTKKSRNKKFISSHIFQYMNWEILLVYRQDEKDAFGWIKLIYGNNGYDVINDYTVNLEKVLKSVNDFTESYF